MQAISYEKGVIKKEIDLANDYNNEEPAKRDGTINLIKKTETLQMKKTRASSLQHDHWVQSKE